MEEQQTGQCWKTIGVAGDGSCEKLAELVHCRNCPGYCALGRTLFDREVPDDYIEEWTESLASRQERAGRTGQLVLVFRLKNDWLALPVGLLKQITAAHKPHRLPHSREILGGLVNVEGQLHLCVFLDRLLQLQAEPADDSAGSGGLKRMIIVQNLVLCNRNNDGQLLVASRRLPRQKSSPNPKIRSRFSSLQSPQRHGASTPPYSCYRVLAETWAFNVDEIFGTYTLPEDQLREVPADPARTPARHTKSVFNCNDRQVAMLDEELLFSTLARSLS